jgi:hypothetical protein
MTDRKHIDLLAAQAGVWLMSLRILALLVAAFTAHVSAAMAQGPSPIPGGATATDVFCVEAGALDSGAFVGTFVQTGAQSWEDRFQAGSGKLEETKRDDLVVELTDKSRSLSFQFDFVSKKIKFGRLREPGVWKDRYHILNAANASLSQDCMALAALIGAPKDPAVGAPTGPGGGARAGMTPALMNSIAPGVPITIPPDAPPFTATGGGPPCDPNDAGSFLCPNGFSCAPSGGVCCPGAGSCAGGNFCDAFVSLSCISAQDLRFCQGTGDVSTGIALHCAPGLSCDASNLCN